MRIQQRPSQTGVALIVVLAFLVLVSAVTVAFLSSSQSEMQSSRAYESGAAVKQLVSTANNIVLAQLSDGTRSSKTGSSQPAVGDRVTWASQPGALRTWDDSGTPWKMFKLYSSRDMVVDIGTAPYIASAQVGAGGKEVPEDWSAQPALFTDLNSPVLVEDVEGGINKDGRKYRAAFPVIDPLSLNEVEGFKINNPPGFSGPLSNGQPAIDSGFDPTAGQGAGKTANPAPMPLAWMYVLRDGTLTVPTGTADDGLTATWLDAPEAKTPSRANPIVGRFAFWADDESCKINVNTASEPTPWDTPRAISIQDLNYGKYQPANKEYQRYPGHPFSTALSPVLFPRQIPGAPPPKVLTPTQQGLAKHALYGWIPRVGQGGTLSAGGSLQAAVTVTPDTDRLFANADEFLFNADRRDVSTQAALQTAGIDTKRLRRSRFFLTANSRAPEVTHYGKPRISLWPAHVTPTSRTAYDRLAAFCTTLGTGSTARQYYFQRSDPRSATADYDGIPRNKQLYEWLRQVTSEPVPGYTGTFLAKWPQRDRDQVLTQIFDYIRSTNLEDTQATARKYADNGQVTPIQIRRSATDITQGFGRFHTVSQFGLHFICTKDHKTGAGPEVGEGQRRVQAALLFTPFSPALGWNPINEELCYQVEMSGFTLDGKNMSFPTPVTRTMSNKIGAGWHNNGRERGGAGGLRGPVAGMGGGGYPFVSQPVVIEKPGEGMAFGGGRVVMRVYSGSSVDPAKLVQQFDVQFPPGKFPCPLLVTTDTAAYKGGDSTTKEFWWSFSQRYSKLGQVPHAPGPEYRDPQRRWVNSEGFPPGFKVGGIFREEDVVRSVVPVHGDLRLIAAKRSVGAEFVPVHKDYWSSKYRFQHLFVSSAGSHLLFGFSNEPGVQATVPDALAPTSPTDQLIPSASAPYHYSRMVEIRPGAGREHNLWNDFDNGVAQWPDGSYINKPDEGNASKSNADYAYWSWNYSDPTEVNFSPNRLVPSAGMLGSLPTGVLRGKPWETLLFRPQTDHPGQASGFPKDHLIMDLFWMPVIEPYAISEPFSTAGKINLNYEIAPFTYIKRATALYGAARAEEILAVPNFASKIYKLWDHETNDNPKLPNDPANQDPQVRKDWGLAFNGKAPFDKLRRGIDMEQTLRQFDNRFAKGEIFRSASEICEVHLVREGEKLEDYENGNFWAGHLVTGENTRERPYANLYAKLTSKSNTFNVHVRAQVLKKATSSDDNEWKVWREDRDQNLSEFRGSSIVERYIDPADPEIPDFAAPANRAAVLDKFYRFRTVATKKFIP